jgi:hypothetical protein
MPHHLMGDIIVSFKAKPVLEDKFWIIENNGIRVGTLSKEIDGFVLTQNGKVSVYDDKLQLNKTFGTEFLVAKITNPDKLLEKTVNGFPTKVYPYNEMYDIKRKLPLFTKSDLSKSVYCAGYYLIKFNVTWLKSFCPKLSTLEQNEFKGPYKSEIEMKGILKLCQ